MVILHVTDVENPKGNGVAEAVSNYIKYEKNICTVGLLNLNNKNYIEGNNSFFYHEYSSITKLPKPFNKPDIVIFNEIYKTKYLKIYKECIKNNIRYVIIPHGCLVKSAQQKHKIKKILGNILLFNKFIKNSIAIQYLNEEEKKNSVFKNKKNIISGNGIDIKSEKNKYRNKNFIYVGRYDLKVKGLDLIVDMIYKYKDWFIDNNVKIKLYGRNAGNGYIELTRIIEEKKISDILEINGPIYGKNKHILLNESYCFIQTSRHEGQPMGVMEALSYGLPCIVTYGTSFGEYVNNNECGIGINFDKDELFDAIKKMYEDEKFRNRCSQNTKIIEQEFDWTEVIKNCIIQYKNLL